MADNGIQEIELKLKLSPEDLEKVFEKLGKKAGGAVKHKHRPRDYYDTQDLRLFQRNVTLRMQYKSGSNGTLGGYEQTVKFAPPEDQGKDGFLDRTEWKDLVADHKPDIQAISDKGARRHFTGIRNGDLVHVFSAAVERRYFLMDVVAKGETGQVEIAFDVGVIRLPHNHTHARPLCEIEIELKSGGKKHIEAVREKILEIAPHAKIQTRTKADQGYDLFFDVEGIDRKILSETGRVAVDKKKAAADAPRFPSQPMRGGRWYRP